MAADGDACRHGSLANSLATERGVEVVAPGVNQDATVPIRVVRWSQHKFSGLSVVGWILSIALAALIIVPLGRMIGDSFIVDGAVDFSPFSSLFADPRFWAAVRNTLLILVTAGPMALVIATALAWMNERTDASLGFLSRMAPLIPLLIPPIALAIGWTFVAQNIAGLLNGYLRMLLGLFGIHLTSGPLDVETLPGLIFVYTIALVPFAYIIIAPAFRNIDASMEEASKMCGAGSLRTAWSISRPAIGPALLSAAFMLVIVCTSMYSIPAVIGTAARIQSLSVYIVFKTTSSGTEGLRQAVAAAVLLVAFIAIIGLLYVWIARRLRPVTISGKSTTRSVVRLGGWKWVARAALIVYLLLVAVLPFVALLIVSMQPFWQPTINFSVLTLDNITGFFTDSTSHARSGYLNSIRLGLIGATLIILIALVLVIFANDRGGRVGKTVLGLVRLPSVVSALVIAVGVLVTFAGPPFSLAGSLVILLLAYVIMFLPQGSIAVAVARTQVGNDLIEASSMAGATSARTATSVVWPLMRPGVAFAWGMMFVLVVSDLEASVILAGPGNPVVGSEFQAIYTSGVFADLAALGVIVCLTSLVIVTIVTGLLGRPARLKDRHFWDRWRRARPDADPVSRSSQGEELLPEADPAQVASLVQ
ncbi:iron ABC transporter permease [Microbacterium sp. BWT-B31]|uniref:ABC transporter permease n=1 Tax=Microbacterium sp. BWT-B31 TaxID=3232072 RepID=UPI003528365B